MSKNNTRSVMALALIMSIRIFNLSMMLPIFTEYASHICHANNLLVGISVGIYGLMQGTFQIPFGALSDRIGRKPVIFLGLSLLLIGSIFCALSNNIFVLILGRALQGAGAIGSSILAYVSDITQEDNRVKAMACIGISIGFSFCLSIIIGPILHSKASMSQIFLICMLTTILSMLLLFLTKNPPVRSYDNNPKFRMLINKNILVLAISVFFLHSILASIFSLIPIIFNELWGCSQSFQGMLYFSFLGLSFVLILPLIYKFRKEEKTSILIFNIVALTSFTQLLLYRFYSGNFAIFFLLSIFFMLFNLLESLLPSMVSKASPIEGRGASMGVYSSFQFLGIFAGSVLSSSIIHLLSIKAVFLFCSFISLLWLLFFLIVRVQL